MHSLCMERVNPVHLTAIRERKKLISQLIYIGLQSKLKSYFIFFIIPFVKKFSPVKFAVKCALCLSLSRTRSRSQSRR